MQDLCITLPNLVEVQLHYWARCKQVPALGQLPFLKHLSLLRLSSVEYISSGLCEVSPSPEEMLFFPSLQELMLMDMSNLKEWQQYLSGKSFSSLLKLRIEQCPKLTSMPLCPSVEDLTLSRIDKALSVLKMAAISATTSSPSSSSCSKLKNLWIDNVEDLISLPKECFHHLSSQDVRDRKLQSTCRLGEVFKSCFSLCCLKISSCDSLRSISRGLEHLSALQKLSICDCKELDLSVEDVESSDEDVEYGMPWEALSHLRSLELNGIHKLVVLPSELQYLPNLHSLEIKSNYELKELPTWISRFSSLERIELHDCPKLTSLPEGFCELTSLNELEIIKCPGLMKRCRGPFGKDWPKIQHIPIVSVRHSFWN